jgi:hypothetical protein
MDLITLKPALATQGAIDKQEYLIPHQQPGDEGACKTITSL